MIFAVPLCFKARLLDDQFVEILGDSCVRRFSLRLVEPNQNIAGLYMVTFSDPYLFDYPARYML